MNKRIEKFLFWACLAQGLTLILQFLSPSIIHNFIFSDNSDLESIAMLNYLLVWLPLTPIQLACGIWLKIESKKMGLNSWLWFFIGFLFKFIGAIAFYVFLIYFTKDKVQPDGVDNG